MKNGSVSPDWLPYLLDVAFQVYVLERPPSYTVKPYLMMPNKSAKCPTDGMNQRIRIKRLPDGKGVETQSNLAEEDLSGRILVEVRVDEAVRAILKDKVNRLHRLHELFDGKPTEEVIALMADYYEKDERVKPQPGAKCQYCEFKADPEEIQKGLRCGFRECWRESFGLTDDDFDRPTILELWNFRKKDELISEGRWRMEDVTERDIPRGKGKTKGLTTSERQWLQIEKAVSGDGSPYIDKEALKARCGPGFSASLHRLRDRDGRRTTENAHPYETIAFRSLTTSSAGRIGPPRQAVHRDAPGFSPTTNSSAP